MTPTWKTHTSAAPALTQPKEGRKQTAGGQNIPHYSKNENIEDPSKKHGSNKDRGSTQETGKTQQQKFPAYLVRSEADTQVDN